MKIAAGGNGGAGSGGRRLALAAALVALTASALTGQALTGPAFAAGTVADGRAIAARWCASCHALDGHRATDGVLSFVAMARDPGLSRDRLAGFLSRPHGGMPPLSLSRQEIDDLIAYILSLRPPAEGR